MPRAVLLVDDSEDDAFFIARAFKEVGLHSPVNHVHDGDQARAYLTGADPYHDRGRYPFPSVALLDLKMPRVSGFEVLRWIRTESAVPWLPVVVLSSSEREEDVERAYAMGASAFITKPNQGDAFANMAGAIKSFWVDLNATPGTIGRAASMPR